MVGLPGRGMHLGIDPLSALFLCLLAPQVLAAAIAVERKSLVFWVFVLGMIMALVAEDSFALILGFELMSAASWLLVLRGDRRPALLYAGIALFSGACLIRRCFCRPVAWPSRCCCLGPVQKRGWRRCIHGCRGRIRHRLPACRR